MNLRKLTLLFIGLFTVVLSCNNDDDDIFIAIPDRDRGEVYEENLIEIEDYLKTHTYNYDEFDFSNPGNPENDNFEIVFDTIITGVNDDKDPLFDRPELVFKIVEDTDIDYKLYMLNVRQGAGNTINFCDTASLTYEGVLLDGQLFDSAVNPTNFSLITIPNVESGIIKGLQQALLEFNTSMGFVINPDGTLNYENYGIGAVFIPSGLGYFSQPVGVIPAYSPLIFKFDLLERTLRDHDLDNIFSFMEDLNDNGNAYDDDTDGDLTPNFIDNDDDGDGYLTRDELEYGEYLVLNGDPEPVFDPEVEFEISRIEELNGDIIISTVIMVDSTGDGTPDFLDKNTIPE